MAESTLNKRTREIPKRYGRGILESDSNHDHIQTIKCMEVLK